MLPTAPVSLSGLLLRPGTRKPHETLGRWVRLTGRQTGRRLLQGGAGTAAGGRPRNL